MDFWSQFWATMWGAIAGALVAGVVSALVAWRSWVAGRDSRYKERLDDALSGLFAEIRRVIDVNSAVRYDFTKRKGTAVETSGLLVEVDRVHMLARGTTDAGMMTIVGKIIYSLPKRTPTWVVVNLPTVVENIRMWRTGEIKPGVAMAAIEALDV